MNYSQIVVATAADTTSISGTITASAESLLLCSVAVSAERDAGNFATPSGWTLLYQGGDFDFEAPLIDTDGRSVVFWKAVATAGDVSVTVNWSSAVRSQFLDAAMHLIEIAGATRVFDYVGSNAGTVAGGLIPGVSSGSAIAVSREGNIGVFTMMVQALAADVGPPTDYSTAQETDVDGAWVLATYYKTLPYSTAYEAQASGPDGYPYMFNHVSCALPEMQAALLGSDF